MPRETPWYAPNWQGTSHCLYGCLGKEKNLPFLGLFLFQLLASYYTINPQPIDFTFLCFFSFIP